MWDMLYIMSRSWLPFRITVSIAGTGWGVSLNMVATAAEALQLAAARAQRRVELEKAKDTVDRFVGYEVGEDQAPWVSVLSRV